MVKSIKDAFNEMKEDIKKRLKWSSRFMICLFIALAFIRLFSLLNEPDYKDIIDYGEKVTALIGALAVITFTYAGTFGYPERKDVREIGERFLNSFLYFVIGLIFSIGFKETLSKPPDLSVFPGILLRLFPGFLVYLSLIIMFILFLAGLVMLIISAVYLGNGIYYLTKSLSK